MPWTVPAPWIVGLALAALAPFLVRALADMLEARARKRTEEILRRHAGE